jgi:hypothetical protein
MLRRKLRLRMDDLKEVRANQCQHVALAAVTWQRQSKAKQNQNNNKPKVTTSFKKKKMNKEDEGCFVCGSPDHWAKKYPNRKGRKPQPEQKTSNMVVSSSG